MDKQLKYYLIAVKHPEVSGFEHLEMLLVRDELAQKAHHLTAEQEAQLAKADQLLLSQAAAFHAALSRITDLSQERHRRPPPVDHWWWYLDVLAQLPAPAPPVADRTPG